MSTKEAIKEIVDEMSDGEAEQLLIALQTPSDELSDADVEAVLRGRAEFERGDWIDLDDLKKELGY